MFEWCEVGCCSNLQGEFSGKIIEGSSGAVDCLNNSPFSKGLISLDVSSEACMGDIKLVLPPLALRYLE